ncbi:MAG: hypothetical protein IPG50_11245 [Myxococcales bacterium]|nr:hypothetical protein [Myxococcales bacterium]
MKQAWSATAWVLSLSASLLVVGSGCSKGDAPKTEPSASASALSAPAAPSAPAASASAAVAVAGGSTPRAYAPAKPPTGDASAPAPVDAGAAVAVVDAAAPAPAAADAGAAASANDEVPKACDDAFGRLGRLTFTSFAPGKVRIAGAKGSSAICSRLEPTKYTCDWIVEGKPTGSFPARFDAAKKSVNGSIDKGKMWNCSKMER